MTKRKNPYWTIRVTRQQDGDLVARTIRGQYPLKYVFSREGSIKDRVDKAYVVERGVEKVLDSLNHYLVENGGQSLVGASVTIKFKVRQPKYNY